MSTLYDSLFANSGELPLVFADMSDYDLRALGQRIAKVAEMMGGKRAFSARTGVSEGQVYRYLKGENAPSVDVVVNISQTAGVSLIWLITGQGEMRPTQTPASIAPTETPRASEVMATYGGPQTLAQQLSSQLRSLLDKPNLSSEDAIIIRNLSEALKNLHDID